MSKFGHLYKFDKNGKRLRVLKDIECPVCHKLFSPRESKRKYCSPECYYEMKRIRKDRVVWTKAMREKMSKRYKGKGNPMFGKQCWNKGKKRPEISGKKHWNWKGGYINKDGYKYICHEGKEISEQRYIVEKHLGRKLSDNEVTHHKNKDVLDNRIENLEVMSRGKHVDHHREDLNKGKRRKKL